MIPGNRLFALVPVCIAGICTLWPAEASAQRRVVRSRHVRTVIAASYGHSFYRPYYDPFQFGWYGPQYRPYPPYRAYFYEPGAELRVQVTPREAEVYVDGYLAGNVDDFDGVFQRLRVPLGEHEVSVYREGYRTITEKMLFRPYESYHLKQAMQPLVAGEAAEPRPVPDPAAAPAAPRRRAGSAYPSAPEAPTDRFGSLAIRVQPAGAEVFVDGERWDTSAGDDRLVVELAEGSHRVEVRKDGFRTYSSTVRVRPGDTVTLNVSLSAGG